MLIRHLKFFVTLAEEQHFGRAAARCNVTQPTLSHAIRKLEDELNLGLIVRGHRFLALTPEGERVLHWGRQILSDYDSLHDDLQGRDRGGLTGRLRLGVIPAAMPAASLLTEAFVARHPGAEIEVRSMTSRAIQRGLDNFEIDGGMTYLDNEPLQHVRCFPLYSETYVFACRCGDAFAGRAAISWAEAVTRPLCLLSGDMQNRRILDAIADRAGVRLAPKIATNSFLGVLSHLRRGPWCAIVPHTFGMVFAGVPELSLMPLTDPAHAQEIGLVLADRMPQSPMVRALQDCALRAARTRAFGAMGSG
ncbi:DNA-binding transcriptional regulator, LysR family [Paracoccus aminovorans]|uniref:DNA-binding transcriptional regulator, LysR family n=1 Tax=Paracoccus aminovorans TaxID=34004 RepID=A0A1I3AKQ9_9RHOB|nr:LysR family transcriptional regulator [Paracoccus aminovorans]CQR86534.1 LysR family transcriptional regulator [Paracoccus aminovorans]SFH50647.1 DNA-binding transcriptional regulator, LysR family [Paracoccus aminovorans]